MMAESFVFPVSRLDLLSFRRLLKQAAESIFDAYSIDCGNGPQFSSTAPQGARFDYDRFNRAARQDRRHHHPEYRESEFLG
jgi:hypothetical protein